MTEKPNPISLPIRVASGVLGAGLALIGLGTLLFGTGREAKIWWLPLAFGALFLLPLFSSPATWKQRPALLRRFRTVGRLERVASVLGFGGLFLCKVVYDRWIESEGPIMEHAVFGPLVVVFSVLFFTGILLQFFVAYYGSKGA